MLRTKHLIGTSLTGLMAGWLLLTASALAADKKPPAAPKPPPVPRTYNEVFERIDRGKSDGSEIPTSGRDRLLETVAYWLAVQKGQRTGTADELMAFVRQHNDWPGLMAFRRRIEDQLLAELSNDKVLDWFQAYPPNSRDGRLRLAEVLAVQGRTSEADELIRKVWIEDAFTATDEPVFLDRFGMLIRPKDHETRLDRLIWRNQDDAAQRQMRRVDGPARQAAEVRLALRAGTPGAEGNAAALPPAQANSAGILYERIRLARKQDRHNDARTLLLKAPADLVRPDLWWDEREIQIRRAMTEGDPATAYRLARDHRLTSGSDLAEAEFLAGHIALRLLRDANTALPHFQSLHDSTQTPISRARGAYWAGVSAEIANRPKDALTWYNRAAQHGTAFYGQLATGKLSGNNFNLPPEPVPAKNARENFEKRDSVRVIRRLAQINATDRTDPFVLRLAEVMGGGDGAALVGELARTIGRVDLGVSVARRVQRDTILIQTGYPRLPLTSESGPELALVHAVVRQESNFSATAISRVGARGLMQLMPTTAKQVAAKLGQPYAEARLTSDPRYNLTLGQAYLGQVVDRFGGSYALALAGYNAGPGRVQQWLRQNGDPRAGEVDMLDWIERIPFAETRNYVQRVLEGMQVYRQVLNRPAPPNPGDLTGNWCVVRCNAAPGGRGEPQ